MEVEIICKCKCGYLSIRFVNGAWNCLTEKTFTTKVGRLPECITPIYKCDACCNDWTVENGQYKLFVIKPSVTWVR